MKKLVAVLLILTTGIAHAQSGEVCNPHGAVVTMDDGTVFYLGKDCDAARKGGGAGKWFNAASFVAVMIDGQTTRIDWDLACDLPFCSVDGGVVPE